MLFMGTVPEVVSVGHIGPAQILTLPYMYGILLASATIFTIQTPWLRSKVIQGPMSLSHLNYVLSMVLFFQVTWTQEGNLPCLGLKTTQDPLFPVQGERNPRKLSSGNDVGLDLEGEDRKNF